MRTSLAATLAVTLLLTPTDASAITDAPDAAGALDPTFGTGGKLTYDFGGTTGDQGNAVALQADGKTIMAGTVNDNFAVARYNTNGTEDLTFVVVTDIGSGSFDQANAIAIQKADGKVVVAGTSDGDIVVARYIGSNGQPDTTFDTDGKVTTDFDALGGNFTTAVANAVAIDTNGKIVVAGYVQNGSEFNDFVLVRYNTNGSLDTTFNPGGLLPPGQAGIVSTSIQQLEYDQAYALAIDANGKIVVVGDTKGTPGQFAMARYNANGSLDTAFGTGGIVLAPSVQVNAAYGVAIQKTDGKIVVTGSKNVYDPNTINCGRPLSSSSLCTYPDFYVARYTIAGTLDSTFGTGGSATTNINQYGNADFGRAVAIQTDGKIVVGGWTETSIHDYTTPNPGDDNFTPINNFALVRYATNGARDTTFGTDGKVLTTNFSGGSTDDRGKSMVIQTDGKIVLAGQTNNPVDFALARYIGDVKFATTTAIGTHTPNPSSVGQAVVVKFSVSDASADYDASGNVTVSDGTASCSGTLGVDPTDPIFGAQIGTCTLTPTSAGIKTLTATFAGDATFLGSSATVTHTVAGSKIYLPITMKK